uniref:Haloacid dehalogenase-like hydrolase n=1 Tax=Streptomyces sp. NBC_01401 TaxID=2903854 RepID=A0AAU3GRU7_9ACTN
MVPRRGGRGRLLPRTRLEALRAHRRDGHRVVLVSGSFPAVLLPLAEHIGAHHLPCTEPEIDPVSRLYTGRLPDRRTSR